MKINYFVKRYKSVTKSQIIENNPRDFSGIKVTARFFSYFFSPCWFLHGV